jgi:hypothetical protein
MAEAFWEKYKHPLWQKKRLEILDRAGFRCEGCQATEEELHVHHSYYAKDKEPWEYPNESLHALCHKCHGSAQYLKRSTNELFGRLTLEDLNRVFGFMSGLFSKRQPTFPRNVNTRTPAQTNIAEGFAAAWGISLDELMSIQGRFDEGLLEGDCIAEYLDKKSKATG